MKADRVGSLLALALGFFLIYQGALLPPGDGGAPGPGFFPLWIGVGLVALSLGLLIRPSVDHKFKDLLPRRGEAWRVAWVLFSLILYTLLLKALGFVISTFLLFLALLQFYRRGKWWVAVLFSLAAVLGSYWLFAKFFDIPLPEGLLPL